MQNVAISAQVRGASPPLALLWESQDQKAADDADQLPAKRRKVSARTKEVDADKNSTHTERIPVYRADFLMHLDDNLSNAATLENLARQSGNSERRSLKVISVVAVKAGELCFSYQINSKTTNHFTIAADVSQHTLGCLQRAVDYQQPKKHCYCESRFLISSTVASYHFTLEVLWINAKSLEEATHHDQNDFLAYLTTGAVPTDSNAWSPSDFYESVHVPDKQDQDAQTLAIDGLESGLYPYQKRAVKWMLGREGVNVNGKPLASFQTIKDNNSHGFFKTVDAENHTIYVSHWLGLVTRDMTIMDSPWSHVSGGILAEEMGLGKTVEIISLVLKHSRKLSNAEIPSKSDLKKSAATLIIAPESIVSQWESEINMHAPSLKTMVYPGISTGMKVSKGRSEKELLSKLLDSDITLCGYRTLAREIHFAEEAPNRSMRHQKQYERKRSPLVLIDWWRCVLDECQMVESGVSNAARVANQIPRQNAWAVSGTPLRRDSGDIFGLLLFLRLGPYCWSQTLWKRLLGQYKPVFKNLINETTLRHTKILVKDDIELPPQKRIVSTVSFTQIEEQHYSNMFDRMCARVGLNREGAPLDEEWDPNDSKIIEAMKSWLTQLRQTCLHPQVGERNRRALGQTEAALRTVSEVLEVMIEQNDAELRHDERAGLLSHLRRGQLLENAGRSADALKIWQDAMPSIRKIVGAARLAVEKAEQENTESTSNTRLRTLRTRLRLALEVEHMAEFFIGNAYYQIKVDQKITAPDSERFQELDKLEAGQYDTAKLLRREILTEPQQAAEGFMKSVESRLTDFARVPKLPEFDETGGIESRGVMARLEDCADQLNSQASKLDEWRRKLGELLLKPLVDQEDREVQGDEYETSMKQQDEVYVRMDIFRAAVADRSDALTGQENILIKLATTEWTDRANRDEGHAPKLMIEMLHQRQAVKPRRESGALRNILAELRAKKTSLRAAEESGSNRARAEITIINKAIQGLQHHVAAQTKATTDLERDVSLFSDTQNARLEFYRQLQHISDSVVSSEKQYSDANYAFLEREERKIQGRVDKREAQARYLSHLKGASSIEAERRCIICQEDNYEIGVLTRCGHLFCKECINHWLSQHMKCPTCKKAIRGSKDMFQITYKPQELRMEEEDVTTPQPSTSTSPESSRDSSATPMSIYSAILPEHLNEIKSIDLAESFSTKIDFIARHIIWLRSFEPGAKTVVFSQYQSFCPGHLANAFKRLKIRFASLGDKRGVDRFKHDPTVECLLMHAGSQASGMNLVNATHVLLCEPLVNTALELQAIARVHRIGQHRPTTVWMYLIDGTIEKAIYDLSVQRRLAHIGNQSKGKGNRKVKRGAVNEFDEEVEAVDAAEMQDRPLAHLLKKGTEGGEIVGNDDLWECLFGNAHARRAAPSFSVVQDNADADAGDEDIAYESETDIDV